MRQTLALFLDAYRELNARKMFWVTLGISALVVLAFAAVGLNEQGLTVLWWEFPLKTFNSNIIPPEKFYKFAFANLGVPIWLTWAAAILALVSTASIIPDFISGGAIELTLSKPIGRLRLFLTKYATGLLFVAVQVLFFTLACFIVIGLRGRSWEPRLFLAVPVVVVFFSYLFCVCALLGLLTRSTIAALLLTILFWIGLFAVNAADGIFLALREQNALTAERLERRAAGQEEAARQEVARRQTTGEPAPDVAGVLPPGEARDEAGDELEAVNPFLASTRAKLAEARESEAEWATWSDRVIYLKTALPKTQETISLLDRWLLSPEDSALFSPGSDRPPADDGDTDFGHEDPEFARRVEGEVRARTTAWILGTSLVFEAVVLAIAGWIFCRRDF